MLYSMVYLCCTFSLVLQEWISLKTYRSKEVWGSTSCLRSEMTRLILRLHTKRSLFEAPRFRRNLVGPNRITLHFQK